MDLQEQVQLCGFELGHASWLPVMSHLLNPYDLNQACDCRSDIDSRCAASLRCAGYGFEGDRDWGCNPWNQRQQAECTTPFLISSTALEFRSCSSRSSWMVTTPCTEGEVYWLPNFLCVADGVPPVYAIYAVEARQAAGRWIFALRERYAHQLLTLIVVI